MKQFIYGTTNNAKLAAMRRFVSSLDIEILSLNDIHIDFDDIKECGKSPLENARIKALAYYSQLKRPVFACDSGLFIEGLEDDMQPGVHVRTIHGTRLNDNEMIDYYSRIAQSLGGKAIARYKNAICLVINENEIYEHFDDDISGDAFCLVDKPHPKRIIGFPLDCISVHIDTGAYYYWLDQPADEQSINLGFTSFFRSVLDNL